jgi:ubiquinone/menaquinone biosynthesis C-methylase UbiE
MTEWDSESADWYAANYGEYATNRLAVDELDLAVGATVVDVGCGTGSALRHAASGVKEGSLIGIDPVPRMIEIARERSADHPAAARIEYREGSAEDLPVRDDSADYVFAFDSIDHWQDVDRGLDEVRRILKPGGQLAVVKDGAVPGSAESRRGLAGVLEGAGFVVVDQRQIAAEGVSFTLWICTIEGQ